MTVNGEQGTVNSPASGVANIPVCLWLGGIREGYGLILVYLSCRPDGTRWMKCFFLLLS